MVIIATVLLDQVIKLTDRKFCIARNKVLLPNRVCCPEAVFVSLVVGILVYCVGRGLGKLAGACKPIVDDVLAVLDIP